jgi:S1-C subfamily serine protease
MKTLRLIIPVAAAMLYSAQVPAQSNDEARSAAEQRQAVETAQQAQSEQRRDEAEVQRQLAEAERRMAEAAQQIAELSSQHLPNVQGQVRRFEFMNDDRPRLGVTIWNNQEKGPVEGVRITAVTPGSAADEAGLRAGDILTSVNSESLSASNAEEATKRLLDFMDGVEQGDTLDVEYLRDGKVGKVEVAPRPMEMSLHSFAGPNGRFTMPAPPAPNGGPMLNFRASGFAWAGSAWGDMELVELNAGLGKYFGTDTGILVVKAPSLDALQLEDGDVIQKIDGREPTSVRHALRILGSYEAGEKLKLQIMRDKHPKTLGIEIPDDRSSMIAPKPAPVARPARQPAAPRAPTSSTT